MENEFKTEFAEFASALSTYFQGGMSPEAFTRHLFSNIYSGSVKGTNDAVYMTEDRTFKSYYYGNTNITVLAKKIAGDLDLGTFASILTLKADDSINDLCSTFSQWCPMITESTYQMDIAERFQTIIKNATKAKRKKAASKAKKADEAATEEKHDTSKIGSALVAEVLSICPNDGCAKSLFTRMGGRIEDNYEVVVIDPCQSTEGEGNLIALCPDCAKKYRLLNDPEKIKRMREIKDRFVRIAEMQDIVSQQSVDEEVRSVLSRIKNLPYPQGVDLNYEPVTLKEKIHPSDPGLLAQIKIWVDLYYPDVHAELQDLNKNGKMKFEPFCLQVKLNFLMLNNKGYSQREIYEKLIDWLMNETNGSRHICEIVIAYFVQKCEVFDAISK